MPVITGQTGARQFNGSGITDYSLFVGGVNATHHALSKYSPLMNGFGRLFMVRAPKILLQYFAVNQNMYSADSRFMQVKHMMEYMNRSIQGFGERTLAVAGTPIMGGYAGRQFNTPTVTKDGTENFQLGMFEFNGSPVFDIIDTWQQMIADENSGLSTYGGAISVGKDSSGLDTRMWNTRDGINTAIEFNEANHTAEFIYILTDRSGAQVERAILLADCFPTSIAQSSPLDYTAGTHDNVTYDISFNCVPYRSPIITSIANDLLKKYAIVSNSLNFNPELGDAVYKTGAMGNVNDSILGNVPWDSAAGTDVGNTPVFDQTVTAKSKGFADPRDIEAAKLNGQDRV